MKHADIIERLQRIRNFYRDTIEDYTAVEAIDKAIEAVEKQEKTFEWCTDCAEYDKERHCCPRFTKVIRQTIEECKREYANEGWIPVTERLPEESNLYTVTAYERGERIVFDLYFGKTKGWDGWWDTKVIAWRKRHEPYTEEET